MTYSAYTYDTAKLSYPATVCVGYPAAAMPLAAWSLRPLYKLLTAVGSCSCRGTPHLSWGQAAARKPQHHRFYATVHSV